MSKNNIFEVGLRLFGICLFIQIPFAILKIGTAFSHDVSQYFDNVLLYRINVILSPVFLMILSLILLFKASSIASFFINDTNPDEKHSAPEGSIYTLSFWIILIGLFYFISSITKIFAQLIDFPVIFPAGYSWASFFSHVLTLFLSVLFIFRSNKVVALIKRVAK